MSRVSTTQRRTCVVFRFQWAILFVLCSLVPSWASSSATLAWDAVTDPSVAGYKVYFGVHSHTYTNSINAGAATTATVANLVAGTTYYFAVTAYNSSGLESLPSNEVSFTPTAPPSGTGTTSQFSNSTYISVPDQGVAAPFPSKITVGSASGTVSKITVTINGLSHTYPADLGLLLAGPTGQAVTLMAHAFQSGTNLSSGNVTLTFDDNAASAVPAKAYLASGTYRPASYLSTIYYPSPAPAGPYGSALAAFNGVNPVGTWSLCVMDSAAPDHGNIARGWSLQITTGTGTSLPPPPTTSSLANSGGITIPQQGPATPYPSRIAVSGVSGFISSARVTVRGYSHTWPQDVGMLLVSPAGQKIALMGHAGGTTPVNNVTITFDDTATAPIPQSGALVTGSYRPATYQSAIIYAAPAPAGPYATALSTLDGFNPNGTWTLYVTDSAPPDQGAISGGWRLDLTTTNAVSAQSLAWAGSAPLSGWPAEASAAAAPIMVAPVIRMDPAIGPDYQVTIVLRGSPGAAFALESSTDLIEWKPVEQGVFDTSEHVYLAKDAATSNHRFYRAVTLGDLK